MQDAIGEDDVEGPLLKCQVEYGTLLKHDVADAVCRDPVPGVFDARDRDVYAGDMPGTQCVPGGRVTPSPATSVKDTLTAITGWVHPVPVKSCLQQVARLFPEGLGPERLE
jgi:hypothetical protein